MVFMVYCLAVYPEEAQKLDEEVEDVNVKDAKALSSVAYLSGFMNETMRMYTGTPTHIYRDTPPEGAYIGGRYITGRTTIVAPRYTIGRLESCFEYPAQSIPSRWTSQPQLVKEKRAFAPFNLGRYDCAERSVALMEMRFMLASMVQKYQISLASGQNAKVMEEMMDNLTATPGNVYLNFKPRIMQGSRDTKGNSKEEIRI